MKVIEITKEFLVYLDEYGSEKKVDFKECNENWLKYRKRSENLSNEEIIKICDKDKCVGQRDIDASPCYIEFFTRPFTKIKFIGEDAENQFMDTMKSIWENGWNTLDMS